MNDTTPALTDQFRLTVDYSQSLEAMMAAGHYDWINGAVTAERFPITGAGTAQEKAALLAEIDAEGCEVRVIPVRLSAHH